MKIGKRGKDLAVRLPRSLATQLDLEAGDEVDMVALGGNQFGIVKRLRGSGDALLMKNLQPPR